MIIGPGADSIERKVFDLKITQTFPIISIESGGARLFSKKIKDLPIEEYNHLSIPPDLNLHLTRDTGDEKHLKFKTEVVNYDSGLLKIDFLPLFTWMSAPISNYRQPHGTWNQAQLIFPPKDSKYSNSTGIFVDFFVHNYHAENLIKKHKLLNPTMRLVGDNSGYIIGPYELSETIRGNHSFSPKFLFSLRFGFYENKDGYSKIHIPFEIENGKMKNNLFGSWLRNILKL
jgi:hypothetical protein